MEEQRTTGRLHRQKQSASPAEDWRDLPPDQETRTELNKRRTYEEVARRHQRIIEKKASTRKWAGRGLIALGVTTLLTSCPMYAISLLGPSYLGPTWVLAGLGLIAGGSALSALTPKIKETHQALLIAAKHGYKLTAAKLALEADISFKKAEKVIQALVRNGIAEIDLEAQDPDDGLVYKIKGL